jgi:hypothetical protein
VGLLLGDWRGRLGQRRRRDRGAKAETQCQFPDSSKHIEHSSSDVCSSFDVCSRCLRLLAVCLDLLANLPASVEFGSTNQRSRYGAKERVLPTEHASPAAKKPNGACRIETGRK